VNVWCGVLGNKLIGPFVFDNNLTGNAYEVFLRNELPGLLEDIPLMIRSQMYFLHDGAPQYYTRQLNSWVGCIILVQFCTKLITECAISRVTSPLGMHVMYSAWNPKDNYDMSASVFVVKFIDFMSLTS